MSKEAIRVSDGIREYASYSEAGRVNGFYEASLGYAFKHSKVKDTCEFRGKTWTRIKKTEKTCEFRDKTWAKIKKTIAPYGLIATAVFLAVVTYFAIKG